MSKQSLKFLRNQVIEDITAQRIREYEAKIGSIVTLPVPIEEIVEQVLGLDFDWDVIQNSRANKSSAVWTLPTRRFLSTKPILIFSSPSRVYSAARLVTRLGIGNWMLTAPRQTTLCCLESLLLPMSSIVTPQSLIA